MTTLVEWTARTLGDGTVIRGYTFNPWDGCTKITAGCRECYAAEHDKRMLHGDTETHWGDDAPRLFKSDTYWAHPLRWNRKASKLGVRLRVFCASLADVLELHPVPEVRAQQDEARKRLFELVLATPMLDWLFVTKRIDNAEAAFPERWIAGPTQRDPEGGFPSNVWVGVTVENKDELHRVDALRELRVFRRFISYEPALGPVDWESALAPCRCRVCGRRYDELPIGLDLKPQCATGSLCHRGGFDSQIHWLIAGHESGRRARPAKEEWIRAARDACKQHGVTFFYKQAHDGRKKISLPMLDDRQHTDVPDSAPIF